MRILQVVTYISPDGAYGGPVRVAINQAKALQGMGHDVIVAAAAGGFEANLPKEYDGFPVRLFPARRLVPNTGFAGLTSPGLFGWLLRAMQQADVVHVHLARDLVTLPAAAMALLARKPLIVQTHGMVDQTDKSLAAPLDRIFTRPILRAARKVLYLTDRERSDLMSVGGKNLDLLQLPNGVPMPKSMADEHDYGPQQSPKVLYLARLHARKRPMVFIRAASALQSAFPSANFSLVGPDEGEGAAVLAALQREKGVSGITWKGPIAPEKSLTLMQEAAIYVLPSTDEPFPMAVLEAMSVGLPVIITNSCGLASMVKENDAGIVCSEAPEDIELALHRLLSDADLRLAMGARARRTIEAGYSMSSVAAALTAIYRACLDVQKASA